MNDGSPAKTASITFHFDEEYQQHVRTGDPDRWIDVSIEVGDTYIWGGNDHGVRGSACGIVLDLLGSAEAVLSGTDYIIEFEWGPDWMVVEPCRDGTVVVSRASTWKGAQNPAKRTEVDTARRLTEDGWIDAVVTAAKDFHEMVIDLNENLRDSDVMTDTRRQIEHIEERAE